ncbi:MAG: methylenetetrahydrofolate reductase [Desulfobacterales bacterium]|jgi:methylenetetrahydrofolate reductase (NADPH)
MIDSDYLVEILTPKRTDGALKSMETNRFAERYFRIIDHGMGVSVPDNPMGQPRHSFPEMIEKAGLPIVPQRAVMNLNTFHTKDELDELLKTAARLGIEYLLVVRGDGGPLLPKLDPKSIGGSKSVVTSIDLIHYINREYAGTFKTGAAFNQYNEMPLEGQRLKRKIEAGARFVITQPVIGKDANVDALFSFDIPLVVEAWMSKNVGLFLKSIRSPDENLAKNFDPLSNLRSLHKAYPENCIYLSMLGFKQRWKTVLPKL